LLVKRQRILPFAPASPSDLDKQHELGQFLTPNPVAEFMASLFEIHRSEVHLLDAGAGADNSRQEFASCVAAGRWVNFTP
jgi:hypothetical protein